MSPQVLAHPSAPTPAIASASSAVDAIPFLLFYSILLTLLDTFYAGTNENLLKGKGKRAGVEYSST